MSALISSQTSEGVAWISFDRPEKRNAFNREMRELFSSVLGQAAADDAVRVIVLTGSGGSFSSGTDLTDAEADDRHVLARNPEPLAAPLERCSKPIIAAVDGGAVGGGFELALAADMRIASRRAFFALTEARIGSLPGSGGTQRLFSAVTSAVAWRMLLTGERLAAERAYEVGLISDLYEDDQFIDQARQLAVRVASAAPLSLRALKVAGRAGMAGAGAAGLELERTLWAFLSTTEDRQEGRAAFREKRDPDFKSR